MYAVGNTLSIVLALEPMPFKPNPGPGHPRYVVHVPDVLCPIQRIFSQKAGELHLMQRESEIDVKWESVALHELRSWLCPFRCNESLGSFAVIWAREHLSARPYNLVLSKR